ncbi:hypothetical protein FJR38_25580 [Anabaena sp. UHCC 0253]|uniref:MAE_28990/MAE_18760 family HEPN-like nuclease n=1 Tax=Anabaena sp. UHCC 0253 TaxID=2590019 RepID=UPI00144822B5|nr:hypothetical protein [Anabaena sp. UHCC 0253]MTJ55795.1 hypothetical protein [Anabaena sp. UHCC 0253]
MDSQNSPDFFDRTLHIDCSKIILRNESINPPKIYEGTGYISRNSEGQLEVKLFYVNDDPLMSFMEHLEELGEKRGNLTVIDDISAKIGAIIEESEYFSLSAFDCQGREWKSMRVIIGERNSNGSLIAQFHEISCNFSIKSNEKASLYLKLPREIDFPSNSSKIDKMINPSNDLIRAEEELKHLYFKPAAHFFACDYEFLIKHQDNSTIIEVNTNCDKLPEMIETRICEALQFVLGDFIEWSMLELNEKDKKTIRIQSFYTQNYKPKLQPPIRFEKLDITDDIWYLYEHYLKHILQYSKKSWHPISGWISRILQARVSYLDSELLTIAVAVESLLKIEPLKKLSESKFSSLKTKSNNLNFESQKSLIVDTIKELNIDDSLQKRLEVFLNQMNSVTTTDRLWNLVEQGLLNQNLVEAWKKVRNQTAHGDVVKPTEIDKYLKLCNKVTVLFNHLVFLAIGYTGNYTDYSEIGWIKKRIQQNK